MKLFTSNKKYIHLLPIVAGFTILVNSDSYFVPYCLILIFSIYCLFENQKTPEILPFSNKKSTICILLFSIFFSLICTISNYPLWLDASVAGSPSVLFGKLYKLFMLLIISYGTFLGFYHIFFWITNHTTLFIWSKHTYSRINLWQFFSFIVMAGINLFIFFSCQYPGVMTTDSFRQIEQIQSGQYSNHHPFFHTQIVRLFMSIGALIDSDINTQVASFSIFQVILVALCFSFAIRTFMQLKLPKKVVILFFLFYTFMPYHIMYSFTVWKDILWSISFLLFLLCGIRIQKIIGKKTLNYIGFSVSGLCVCLMRHNGFFVYILLALFTIFIFKKSHLFMKMIMLITILVSFLFQNVYLEKIGVTPVDIVQSLSIPIQQISRVIVEENDLTPNEKEVLSQIVDIDLIPEAYVSHLADPTHELIRGKNNLSYIENHPLEVLATYLSIGLRHPDLYLKAWVDQTKGYWNSGYRYWYWAANISENDLGLFRSNVNPTIDKYLNVYLWVFTQIPVLYLFLCIGVYFWIHLFSLFIGIITEKKILIWATLPSIFTVLSLVIATIVAYEFRYAYPMFCMTPVVIALTFSDSF